MKRLRHLAATTAVAVAIASAVSPTSAQLIVFDPNNYAQNVLTAARELQQIRYQANNLARQGRLTRSESRDLFRDIQRAERVINRKSRYGLSRSEARSLNERIGKIQYELRVYSDRDGRRYRRW